MSADKHIVVRGRVAGGHVIADIGVEVPYEETVHLSPDQTSYSSDLDDALDRGLIEVEHTYMDRQVHTSSPPPAREQTSEEDTSEQPDQNSSSGEDEEDEEDIYDLSRRLAQTVELMADRHGEVLDRLDRLVETIDSQEDDSSDSIDLKSILDQVNQSSPSSSTESDDHSDSSSSPEKEGTETFIPSDIGEAEKRGKVSIESDSSKSDKGVSEALEELEEMDD